MLGPQLRRIVEEDFLGDALAFPALAGELLHARGGSVQPFELEDPADHHPVAVHEDRLHAPRAHRPGPREHLALVRHERIAPDARRGAIFLHRRVFGVELLDRLGMRILFHPRNESIECGGARHGRYLPAPAQARLSILTENSKCRRGMPPTCGSGTHHSNHSSFEMWMLTGRSRTSHFPTTTFARRTSGAHFDDHAE